MQCYNYILCIFSMLQIVIGIFGNGSLLLLCSFNCITGQRIRLIGVIFINLALSYIMLILFRGVPLAIQICNQKISLSDIECKIIVYFQRVSWGVSLCTTCHLSVFQAITISPSSLKCAEVKVRVPKCIVPSCVFIWVLNLLVDIVVPLYVKSNRNSTVSNLKGNLGYCSVDWHAISTSKLIIWNTFYDAGFVLLMAISSGYMVLVLFRHHRQVQHLHKTSLHTIASPETRATKVVLLLMIMFVCFYSLASINAIVMENSKHSNLGLMHITIFLSVSYSIVTPIILISNDSQMLNCNVFKRMKNSYPHSIRFQNNHI